MKKGRQALQAEPRSPGLQVAQIPIEFQCEREPPGKASPGHPPYNQCQLPLDTAAWDPQWEALNWSPSPNPGPQNGEQNGNSCFKLLNFRAIHYSATATGSLPQGFHKGPFSAWKAHSPPNPILTWSSSPDPHLCSISPPPWDLLLPSYVCNIHISHSFILLYFLHSIICHLSWFYVFIPTFYALPHL